MRQIANVNFLDERLFTRPEAGFTTDIVTHKYTQNISHK